MTPTEHAAVKAAAEARGIEIVDLIRAGLALVLDQPASPAVKAKGKVESSRGE